MTDEPMSSNKRIQLLRERLEMYNATIAEAMGVVADVTNTEKSALPINNNNNNLNKGDAAGATRQEEGANRRNTSREFAPRLDRDLASEFDAAHFHGDASRRNERRTVPPRPSPPEERRRVAPMLSSATSSSDGGEGSSTFYSDSDDGTFVNPFLNEPVSATEHIAASLREMQHAADGVKSAAVASVGGQEKNVGAFSPTSRWMKPVTGGDPQSLLPRGDEGEKQGEEEKEGEGVKGEKGVRKLKSLFERWHGRGVEKDEGEDDDDDDGGGAALTTAVVRTGESEVKENTAASSPVASTPSVPLPVPLPAPLPFDVLETTCNKLKLIEQAILKLREIVDVDQFSHTLPKREQAQRLANSRDELIKKEQLLRQKVASGRSLATIHDSDVMGIDKEVRQLLTECEATKSLFTRVHDRKAAIAEKGRLLKKRLNELEDLQCDVREKRQALAALEQRTEQREALVLLREDAYKRDLGAHKAQEQALRVKISEVESLSRKVSSWMKILEDRDTEMAAKEQRLRRVQSDLVRRSEELLCYRSGRAREPTRVPARRVKSP